MSYTPTTINPLQAWVQTVIPTVYDDSLSYLEFLGKVLAKLNELIASDAAQSAALSEFLNTFEADLSQTVTEYLNIWKEDGTIQAILTASLDDFNEALDLHKAEVDALFVDVNADIDALETAVNGKMTRIVLNVKDFGAIGNGTTDDTVAIQTAMASVTASIKTIFIPAGTYLISSSLLMTQGMALIGEGSDVSILKCAPLFTGSAMIMLSDTTIQFCEISKIGLLGVGTYVAGVLAASNSVGGIYFINDYINDEKKHRIRNISLRYIGGTALKVFGRGGSIIENIDIYRPVVNGIWLNLWDSRLSNLTVGQAFNGKGIWLDGAASLSISDSTAYGCPYNYYIDGAENNLHGIQSQESKEYGILLASSAKRNRISGTIDGNGYNHSDPLSSAVYVNSDQNIIDLTITNRLMAVYGGDCMLFGLTVSGKYNQIRVTIDGATTNLNPVSDVIYNRIIMLDASGTKLKTFESYSKYWSKVAVTSGANLLQAAAAGLRPRSAQFLFTIQDTTDRSLFATYIVTYIEGTVNTLYLLANKTMTLTSTNTYGTVTITGGSGTYDVSATMI